MPSIQYAHLCEYARIDQSGTVSIIGIFNTIHVSGLPANFPFLHVITSLSGQTGERFHFLTRLALPDGSILHASLPAEIVIQREDIHANHINGYLGVVFPVFGMYSVEFVVDETVVHSIPFHVVPQQSR